MGYAVVAEFNEIAPYPVIAIGAVSFYCIVPAIGKIISIDIGVAVEAPRIAVVFAAADAVIGIMTGIAVKFIIPYDVITRRIILKSYVLRSLRMGSIAPCRLVPIIGSIAGIVNSISLDYYFCDGRTV